MDREVWVPVAAALAYAVVRLAKEWPDRFPPRVRPWLAVIVGGLTALADALLAGTPWGAALASGLVAALVAIGGHELGVESARGGKELGGGGGTGRGAVMLLLMALSLSQVACPPSTRQVQAQVATSMAQAVNALTPALAAAERAEGDGVIARADTLEEAQAGLEAVRARWAPVWAALDALAAAHDAWASAIESGGPGDWQAVAEAYCALQIAAGSRAELPEVIPCS